MMCNTKKEVTVFLLLLCMGVHAASYCFNMRSDKNTFVSHSNLSANHSSDSVMVGKGDMTTYESYLYDTIGRCLKDDEIVIKMFSLLKENGQTEYGALSVRKEYKEPHAYTLFDENELIRELERGDTLYADTIVASMFLRPLREELDGVRKIFFIPAGKMHLFAIEYCNAGEGLMLSEKYDFYRLTSSAVLTHRDDIREKIKSYVIYGGIDFEMYPDFEEQYDGEATKSRYGYLEDSYLAAKEVHNYLRNKGFSGTLYANEAATETSFKILQWQNYQLLFIETHGVFDPRQGENPYPNALMLAGASYVMDGGIVPDGKEDDLLTTKEIANLDLSSVDLAVISACKSAIGEIDNHGVDGLMRAFKNAGVNSLAMTTDDVVDYVSGEVWKVFFKNIANGKDKRESLLDAVKNVRTINDGFYSAPKYWTPYILIDGLDEEKSW